LNVLIDTSVWSQVLRRRDEGSDGVKDSVAKLIEEYRAKIIGPIRQEILSGIPDKKQFEALRIKLLAFDDLPIVSEDYERAAGMFNDCRKKGIQGSHVDFLICAVSVNHGLEIFTLDKDFRQYGKVLDIILHAPRRAA
jgi:predicted nucleic acid-binding protein